MREKRLRKDQSLLYGNIVGNSWKFFWLFQNIEIFICIFEILQKKKKYEMIHGPSIAYSLEIYRFQTPLNVYIVTKIMVNLGTFMSKTKMFKVHIKLYNHLCIMLVHQNLWDFLKLWQWFHSLLKKLLDIRFLTFIFCRVNIFPNEMCS